MLNSIASTNELHTKHILLIVIIGLVLHFPLVSNNQFYIVLVLATIVYSLSCLLSILNNRLFNGSFQHNSKAMKILLYISSLTYTSLVIEALNHYGLTASQSAMFTMSIILILQAISANLDHILVNTWKITVLDLCILTSTVIAIIISFEFLNIVLFVVLTISLSLLLFMRSVSSLVFVTLFVNSLTSSRGLVLLNLFAIAPLIAYAYGYASAMDKLATLMPCYDNKSLLAVVMVTVVASVLTMCASINKLIQAIYHTVLFVTFCCYVVALLIGIIRGRTGNRGHNGRHY